jgi:hypothetical protein
MSIKETYSPTKNRSRLNSILNLKTEEIYKDKDIQDINEKKNQNKLINLSNILEKIINKNINIYYLEKNSSFKNRIDELIIKYLVETENFSKNKTKNDLFKSQEKLLIFLIEIINCLTKEIKILNKYILNDKNKTDNSVKEFDKEIQIFIDNNDNNNRTSYRKFFIYDKFEKLNDDLNKRVSIKTKELDSMKIENDSLKRRIKFLNETLSKEIIIKKEIEKEIKNLKHKLNPKSTLLNSSIINDFDVININSQNQKGSRNNSLSKNPNNINKIKNFVNKNNTNNLNNNLESSVKKNKISFINTNNNSNENNNKNKNLNIKNNSYANSKFISNSISNFDSNFNSNINTNNIEKDNSLLNTSYLLDKEISNISQIENYRKTDKDYQINNRIKINDRENILGKNTVNLNNFVIDNTSPAIENENNNLFNKKYSIDKKRKNNSNYINISPISESLKKKFLENNNDDTDKRIIKRRNNKSKSINISIDKRMNNKYININNNNNNKKEIKKSIILKEIDSKINSNFTIKNFNIIGNRKNKSEIKVNDINYNDKIKKSSGFNLEEKFINTNNTNNTYNMNNTNTNNTNTINSNNTKNSLEKRGYVNFDKLKNISKPPIKSNKKSQIFSDIILKDKNLNLKNFEILANEYSEYLNEELNDIKDLENFLFLIKENESNKIII